MEKTLFTDERYSGKYVALKSQEDSTVVGMGKDPEEALREAEKNGFKKSYIIYIPEKEVAQVY